MSDSKQKINALSIKAPYEDENGKYIIPFINPGSDGGNKIRRLESTKAVFKKVRSEKLDMDFYKDFILHVEKDKGTSIITRIEIIPKKDIDKPLGAERENDGTPTSNDVIFFVDNDGDIEIKTTPPEMGSQALEDIQQKLSSDLKEYKEVFVDDFLGDRYQIVDVRLRKNGKYIHVNPVPSS